MSDSLPPLMLARLTTLGTALTTWAAPHTGASLADQEAAVLTLVRTALPDVLRVMLTLTTPALARRSPPVPHPCPTGQRWVPLQSWRSRQLATQCGLGAHPAALVRRSGMRPWV